MKTNILVTVRDRVPEIADGADVITHNSDYTLTFDFDAEWANGVKTVYFAAEDGTYRAVVMNGNSCDVPMLDGEHRRIFVGVQQGTSEKPDVLKTSRPCCLKVVDSIADYVGEQIPDPEPSVYEQIIAMLEKVTTPTWQDVTDKPFETLGDGLEVDENGVLSAPGGGGGTVAKNAVLYTAQELTDEQQAQARTNIGAGAESEIQTLSGEIKTKLDRSNTEFEIIYCANYPWKAGYYDANGHFNGAYYYRIALADTNNGIWFKVESGKYYCFNTHSDYKFLIRGYSGTTGYDFISTIVSLKNFAIVKIPDNVTYITVTLSNSEESGDSIAIVDQMLSDMSGGKIKPTITYFPITAGSGVTISEDGMITAAVEVDETLTQSGSAADAKAVGDEFVSVDTTLASITRELANKQPIGDYLTSETDPTVPAWAKSPTKPTYTAKEVGALPDTTVIPAVPTTLPNPHKLTFTGAVTGEYDGSSALTLDIPQGEGSDRSLGITAATVGQIAKITAVENGVPTAWEAVDLPSGGGGETWELIASQTVEEDVLCVDISVPSFAKLMALVSLVNTSVSAGSRSLQLALNGNNNRKASTYDNGIIRTSGTSSVRYNLEKIDGRIIWSIASSNSGDGVVDGTSENMAGFNAGACIAPDTISSIRISNGNMVPNYYIGAGTRIKVYVVRGLIK